MWLHTYTILWFESHTPRNLRYFHQTDTPSKVACIPHIKRIPSKCFSAFFTCFNDKNVILEVIEAIFSRKMFGFNVTPEVIS